MTSALVLSADPSGAAALESDLKTAGIHMLGATARHTLVRDAARLAPDIVVCWDDHPDDTLFQEIATLARVAPCPVLLFTTKTDAQCIAQGIGAGIHAYVVSGYEAHRLRALIQVAQARFQAEQAMRSELVDLQNRYEERTLVDRAKGILMQAGGLSEDEAFRMLRTASQRDQRRVGQVSRRLIEAARAAEAVNRAGQLRMLSQRIVKLQALRMAGTEVAGALALLEQSSRRVQANLKELGQLLSDATYGDLLMQVIRTWSLIESTLQAPLAPIALADLDRSAEQLLVQADRLVKALGGADPAGNLHVINVCGRQRMLSQRLAKQALLGSLIEAPLASASREGAVATAGEFEQALRSLKDAGHEAADIRTQLENATRCWYRLRDSLHHTGHAKGRLELAAASEELLEIFEQLTDGFEHSLQVLLGSADHSDPRPDADTS